MIIANVNNQILTLRVEGVVSDSVRFLTVKFNFNDAWRTKTKVAVFKSETKDYPIIFADGNSMYLGDNVCFVPQEVIKHPCFSVSIYGVENNVIITTNEELVDVIESGYGDFLPEDPTPEIWNQLLMANATFAHCPSGGSEGKVLKKASNDDFDMVWGDTDGMTKEEAEDEFVQKTVKINNKPLSNDISLSASDVGALPDDTPIPTKTSDLTNDSGFGTYSKPSGGIPKTDLNANVKLSLEKADTALQEHQSLEGYATEDYVDDAVDTKYTKPSDGIPKTDLSSSVQESLGKADTALQQHQSLDWKQDKFAEVFESTYSRYLSLTRPAIISGHLEVPDPSRSSDVCNKQYVDDAVSTKYTKPDGGIPETDLASAVKAKINNSYVYDTKPYEAIPIGDEADGSLTLTEALTTRLVIDKDINNVNFNFRKILVNITVPAEITEGTPTAFMVGSNSYTLIGTQTIKKLPNYPMRLVGVFELRNGILFTDGAYSTGSYSIPQVAVYKSYNALGTALNSLTMITIEGAVNNLPAGTNIKILAVKGE